MKSRIIGIALGSIIPIIITAHIVAVIKNGAGADGMPIPGMSSMPDMSWDKANR